ncbi:BLUF domain-containing protein [Breoghania sp. L-A4]|uniref:BLUF domain-containing protein n=1 Tax=Breoghania sp. L-A4 TaxID=2304600 RepID=UPI000E35CBF1|nr:BLUF domain-containing protein [Breoghania sp. L-A4]AXS40124.1 BLUF domain-containing protein [Breoghania sp. L-A4]
MGLYQICYRSQIHDHVLHGDMDAEIERTTTRLRRLNRLNGITGALILTDTHIFQLIEGRVETIEDALECAAQDPRHHSIEILSRKAVEYRLFHDSWLYFADLRMDTDRDLPADIAAVMPNPATASVSDVLGLMGHVSGDLAEGHLTNELMLI